jgi:hypothetical protein
MAESPRVECSRDGIEVAAEKSALVSTKETIIETQAGASSEPPWDLIGGKADSK